jgi:DNA-binding GntR family transcriptional regulator
MAQQSGTSGPKYRQIADDLRARIDSGEYPPGSQLPTKADLMATHHVALNTVERAIEELRREGLVETIQGSGMFTRQPPTAGALADADREPGDTKALSEHIAALGEEVRRLRELVDSLGVDEVRAIASRIEVNLIDLYGKLGFDYPRDEADNAERGNHGTKAASEREHIA